MRVDVINYNEDWPYLIKMGQDAFKLSASVVEALAAPANLTYSRKVVLDDKIVGYYLLQPRCVLDGLVRRMRMREDLSGYRHRNGVEGVALVVDPTYRGHGIGKRLMDLPKDFGFDYVWGYQNKNLKNIHHWMKRRRLVARLGQLFVTLQDLG